MTSYEQAIEAIAKQMCLMERCDIDPCESGQCYDENKCKADAILSLKGEGWRLAIVQDGAENGFVPELSARYKRLLEEDYVTVSEALACSDAEDAFHRLHEGTIAATKEETKRDMLDAGFGIKEIKP